MRNNLEKPMAPLKSRRIMGYVRSFSQNYAVVITNLFIRERERERSMDDTYDSF